MSVATMSRPISSISTSIQTTVCTICKNKNHDIWARSYDDKGNHMFICRLCWEAQYPCDQNANFVKIPYRIKCLLAWTLTTPTMAVTIQPGNYEIGVVDAYTDVITLWSYHDELMPVEKEIPTFLRDENINKLRHTLLKSSCSCEDGYIPIMTTYSFVKRYGILYRKDAHIKRYSF